MNNLSIRKMTEVSKKKKKGFTLIELIIVIAIIAILAAIAIPKFGEIRSNANSKADMATAKNIATSVAAKIANGDTVLSGSASSLSLNIDGGITPKVGTHSFYVEVTTGGNIVVHYDSSSGDVVYPVS